MILVFSVVHDHNKNIYQSTDIDEIIDTHTYIYLVVVIEQIIVGKLNQ